MPKAPNWNLRYEVTFPDGNTHGYTFTEERWYDFFIDGWKNKGYKVKQKDK